MNSRFTDEQLLVSDDAFLIPKEREYKKFLIENKKRIKEHAKQVQEAYEYDKAEKINHDAMIFYPHDLEGKQVELDAEAFKVIEAWETVPVLLKKAIVAIANIRGAA